MKRLFILSIALASLTGAWAQEEQQTTDFKTWFGADCEKIDYYNVETGYGDSENNPGYWYDLTDNVDGGNSKITYPVDKGDEYDDNSLAPIIKHLGGMGGSYTLNKGSLTYDPFVKFYFTIAGEESDTGKKYLADATAMGGLCVTYTCDHDITLELGLDDAGDSEIGYAQPCVTLEKSATPVTKAFKWSDFKQKKIEGTIKKEITGEEAAKSLGTVNFKIEGPDGIKGNVLIYAVGAYNDVHNQMALSLGTKKYMNPLSDATYEVEKGKVVKRQKGTSVALLDNYNIMQDKFGIVVTSKTDARDRLTIMYDKGEIALIGEREMAYRASEVFTSEMAVLNAEIVALVGEDSYEYIEEGGTIYVNSADKTLHMRMEMNGVVMSDIPVYNIYLPMKQDDTYGYCMMPGSKMVYTFTTEEGKLTGVTYRGNEMTKVMSTAIKQAKKAEKKAEKKAVKTVRNGKVVIIKDGETRDLAGRKIN